MSYDSQDVVHTQEEMKRTAEPMTFQVFSSRTHLLTDVSNAIALVVRHTQCRHTWFEQQKMVKEMKGFGRLELLDEEALRAMVRTAVQGGRQVMTPRA